MDRQRGRERSWRRVVGSLAVLVGLGVLFALTRPGRPAGPVNDLDGVRQATVAVRATGLLEPDGRRATRWASGFALGRHRVVTAAHAVTGARRISVQVPGEAKRRAATLVGSSDCHDLAVLDVGGEPLRFLRWSGVRITGGLDVFTAAFPENAARVSLTRGIITRTGLAVDGPEVSARSGFEHRGSPRSAAPGGPVVTADGELVGVTPDAPVSSGLATALGRDGIRAVLAGLDSGAPVASLGANVSATRTPPGGPGLWVAGVRPGSPVDRLGVRAGDLITKVGGKAVGTDGTLEAFCDVLRTRRAAGSLPVTVRRAGGLTYSGAVASTLQNLRAPLEPSFSFADRFGRGVPPGSTPRGGRSVSDRSGRISMEVPAAWTGVNGAPVRAANGSERPALTVSGNLDRFNRGFDVAGVAVVVFDGFGPPDIGKVLSDVGARLTPQCGHVGHAAYAEKELRGRLDVYERCGPAQAQVFVVAAGPAATQGKGSEPKASGHLVLVAAQVLERGDLAALDRLLDTMTIEGVATGSTGLTGATGSTGAGE